MAAPGRQLSIAADPVSDGSAVRNRSDARSGSESATRQGDTSVTAIAKLLGVSPGTLYNHIPDLRELRAAGRARTRPIGRHP
ncbi:hypothetical protein Ate01nite_39900 [Actinoplanes teichomyceticus]|nr:hypothetical protein Ate01nite_39900 [Actinoplanes teichomyceticus]